MSLTPPDDRAAPFHREGHDLHPLIREVVRIEDMDRLLDHPAFDETVRRTLGNWVPPGGEHRSLGNLLRDVGMFMAAIWAVQLDAEPSGLTRASLAGVMADWGVASSGRVSAILGYLQLVKLIEPHPVRSDVRRLRPTQSLRRLFHDRFRRELTTVLPVFPQVQAVLDRWDEPAVFEGFMVANGHFMLASQRSLNPEIPTLGLFSHRKSGMTVLGQIILAADTGGTMPPSGPVELNISELARVTGASRPQVRSVVKVGEGAGFLRTDAARLTHFSPELVHHVSAMVRMYWISMAWMGDQALLWADRKAEL